MSKYCGGCGAEINENEKFCSKCGTKIDEIVFAENESKVIVNENSKSKTIKKVKSNKTNGNKKKNKKILILVICMISIILICSGVWLVYHLSQEHIDYVSEAKTTVITFFDKYSSKSGDANNYLTATSMDDTPITYEGYQGYCAEKINYEIIGATKSENDSELIIVTVKIENIDLKAILEKLDEKTYDNDEKIIESFYSLLQSNNLPTNTYQCDIKCKAYPAGMKILFDSELSNALLGGYSAYIVGNNN